MISTQSGLARPELVTAQPLLVSSLKVSPVIPFKISIYKIQNIYSHSDYWAMRVLMLLLLVMVEKLTRPHSIQPVVVETEVNKFYLLPLPA